MSRRTGRVPALLLALALCGAVGLAGAAPPRPRHIDGTVFRVTDGDSLWLRPADGKAPVEVRLAGIDAPEICQEGGPAARDFLAELVLNKAVRLELSATRDAHGRTLGTVHLGELVVNRRLVEEGQAWSQRYKWDRGPYVSQERMARALNRGVHKAGAGAVMPRDFRRLHGPCPVAGGA